MVTEPMVRFTEIIEASLEWTATVLFRPFKPKKWLILIFVALMAGYLNGGCHLNLNGGYNNEKDKKPHSPQSVSVSTNAASKEKLKLNFPSTPREIKQYICEQLKKPLILTLVISIILLFLILFVLFVWLGARFAFVFLDNITKNDASVIIPFKAHREIGNSFFLFSLIFSVLALSSFGLIIFYLFKNLISLGVFTAAAKPVVWKIIVFCVCYGLLFLFWVLVVLTIAYLIVMDFIVPLMFKDKIKFMAAYSKFAGLFNKHKREFFTFWALRVGLSICCSLCSGIFIFLAILVLIIPVGIIVFILFFPFYFLYKAFPIAYFILLSLIGVPILLFIGYCLCGIILPFGIFLRTLSLKFLARIDGKYDFFKYQQ